jgi:hypothetical protein
MYDMMKIRYINCGVLKNWKKNFSDVLFLDEWWEWEQNKQFLRKYEIRVWTKKKKRVRDVDYGKNIFFYILNRHART